MVAQLQVWPLRQQVSNYTSWACGAVPTCRAAAMPTVLAVWAVVVPLSPAFLLYRWISREPVPYAVILVLEPCFRIHCIHV